MTKLEALSKYLGRDVSLSNFTNRENFQGFQTEDGAIYLVFDNIEIANRTAISSETVNITENYSEFDMKKFIKRLHDEFGLELDKVFKDELKIELSEEDYSLEDYLDDTDSIPLNLLNIDYIAEFCVNQDGAKFTIATYDNKEINLDNGFVAYRIN